MSRFAGLIPRSAEGLLAQLKDAPTPNPGNFRFELVHQSKVSGARAGILHTPHASVPTPCFVPVATVGALKCVDLATIDVPNPPLAFCNTFHLLCSSTGPKRIEELGGLHKFMGLKPGSTALITDSGGFQVFSLSENNAKGADADEKSGKVDHLKGQRGFHSEYRASKLFIRLDDNGALFRSPRNGNKILLSPELSIETQKQLGADFIVAMDELPPLDITPEKLFRSVRRTHGWELRSLAAHFRDPRHQSLFGIVHGGSDRELRLASADFVASMPFDGIAFGGSIGGTKDEMLSLLSHLTAFLQGHQSQAKFRPRHLLGIGDPYSLDKALRLGIDSFDSAFPTRAARHATIFKLRRKPQLYIEPVQIRRAENVLEKGPIDPECQCATCQTHSIAYLHHLVREHEPLFGTLATVHNIYVWQEYMKSIRDGILKDEV